MPWVACALDGFFSRPCSILKELLFLHGHLNLIEMKLNISARFITDKDTVGIIVVTLEVQNLMKR